jgi:hypothetical protein
MSFSEIELKRIEKLVRGLCERRSPAYLKDKVQLDYAVKNHEILIYEVRPRWDEPSEWVESSIAKLRYVRASNEWRLYWQRANLKWWLYEPHSSSKNLSSMLDEIDSDPNGCFFG